MDNQVCTLYHNSILDGNETGTTCAGSNRTSRTQDLAFFLVGMPIPLLSVVVNAIILLAAGMRRKILKQHNYVFSSVCSTLVSNMLYAVLGAWMTIANYFKFMEDGIKLPDEAERQFSETWWIIRNSTSICLLLAMCGNIGSLVFVLMDSTYFVGRNSRHINKTMLVDKDENQQRCRYHLTRRGKTHLLISLSWLVPALLVMLASSTEWNCLKCCCPLGHYDGDSCAVEAGCSRFWPPVTRSFLGVFLGLWLLEVILMVLLLVHTSLKFRQIVIDSSLTFNGSVGFTKTDGNSAEDSAAAPSSDSQARRQSSLPGCDATMSEDNADPEAADKQSSHKPSLASDVPMQNHQKNKNVLLRFVRKFYSKMKSIIFLAAAFFVFTLPVAVSIIVDVSTGEHMPGKNALIVVSELSTYIYTLVCPIILLKFMPKLKLSVTMCMFNCGRVCKK